MKVNTSLTIESGCQLVIRSYNRSNNVVTYGEDLKISKIRAVDYVLNGTDYYQPILEICFYKSSPRFIGYFKNIATRNTAFDIICQRFANSSYVELELEYDEFFKKEPSYHLNVINFLNIDVIQLISQINSYYGSVRSLLKDFKLNSKAPRVHIDDELTKILIEKKTELEATEFAGLMASIPSRSYFTYEMAEQGLTPYTLWFYLYLELINVGIRG